MTRFLQLHALTFYPPSNLNRDDLGRPKTADVGGAPRLRISSQCLKRAWRTDPLFGETLAGKLGTRTKRIGTELVLPVLRQAGIADKEAKAWAIKIREQFANKGDKNDPEDTAQLVHLSPEERQAIEALAHTLAREKRAPGDEELAALRGAARAVDIAMFGRMMADFPRANVEAAVQVAHAFTTNKVALEDDFFTAVDDLNQGEEDLGAGHLNETWFGSGVFYLYLCVNREQLAKNLGGNRQLAGRAVRALTRAVAEVSPHGKQNGFAARARASYLLAERGDDPPRSLALAFLDPVGRHFLKDSVQKLKETKAQLDHAYGATVQAKVFHPTQLQVTLADMLDFVDGD